MMSVRDRRHGQPRSEIEGNEVSKANLKSAVVLIVASLLGTAAFAHADLKSAEPAAGSAATTSPTQIRITFSEAVIAKFSGVELKDQAGKLIAIRQGGSRPGQQERTGCADQRTVAGRQLHGRMACRLRR
jgi:methionine-rich copper-binding protein CopC